MKTIKKERNNKTNILICISIIIMMIVNNTVLSANYFLNSSLNNSIEGRKIYVDFNKESKSLENEVEELLKNNSKVLSYYENYEITYTPENFENVESIVLSGFDYDTYENYIEENKIKNLKENEIIIPKYYSKYSMFNAKKEDLVDMSFKIGETIKGKIDNITKETEIDNIVEFKIVGVYDNIKTLSDSSVFLINKEKIKELQVISKQGIEDNDEEGILGRGLYKLYYVFAKDYKDVQNILQNIYENSFDVYAYSEMIIDGRASETIKIFMMATNFVLFLIIVNTFITTYYNTENSIKKRRKEFGLLKAIGYDDKQIKNILFFEAIRTNVVVAIIAFGIYFIYQYSANYIIHTKASLFYMQFNIKPHLSVFLISFGILSITTFLALIVSTKKLSKLDPIEALKDYE